MPATRPQKERAGRREERRGAREVEFSILSRKVRRTKEAGAVPSLIHRRPQCGVRATGFLAPREAARGKRGGR